jgi:hypothetical protein
MKQPKIEDFAAILEQSPLEIDLLRGGVNQMCDDELPQVAAEDESC